MKKLVYIFIISLISITGFSDILPTWKGIDEKLGKINNFIINSSNELNDLRSDFIIATNDIISRISCDRLDIIQTNIVAQTSSDLSYDLISGKVNILNLKIPSSLSIDTNLLIKVLGVTTDTYNKGTKFVLNYNDELGCGVRLFINMVDKNNLVNSYKSNEYVGKIHYNLKSLDYEIIDYSEVNKSIIIIEFKYYLPTLLYTITTIF